MIDSSWSKAEIQENFWEIVYQTIGQFAEKDYVVTTNGSITFQQANNLGNILYQEIIKATTKSKIGVGLYFQDPLKIVPGMLGTIKANDYFIVMDTGFPAHTVTRMIDTAEIKVILTDDEFYDKIHATAGDNVIVINIDTLDQQRQTPNPEINYNPDNLMQIIFTSGSTGQPKGVKEDYRYLARAMHIKRIQPSNSSEEKAVQLSSFIFGGPHTSIFAALIIGFTTYIYDVKTEGFVGLKDWMQQKKITIVRVTPTVFRSFVRVLGRQDKFPHVHSLHLGGEKRIQQDLPAIRRHFPNVKYFHLGFASSETQVVSDSVFSLDYKFEGDILPCGVPLGDIQVYIWDEQGNELPSGEAGEIVVYGDALARGYINNAELTKDRFLPDPNRPLFQYFKTGDLGKILADGQLIHLGRMDSMVKIKGVRIELNSVENRILSYPGITQVVIKALEEDHNAAKLIGYFVTTPGVKVPISDLRQYLASHLPRHLLPHYLIQLDSFPTTPTGKINKNLLPSPKMVRPDLNNPYQPPGDELEKTLAAIWEELLGIKGIGVTDDFYDVGGDSLLGVLLFVEIEKVLGKELPVSVLLTASTVRQQAELIRGEKHSDPFKPILPINIYGSTPPLFFIPGKGGYPTRLRHLAKRLTPQTPIYALQEISVPGSNNSTFKSISSTAAFYISQIKRHYSHGPYYLVGESLGGKVALEMAQQLIETGEQIPILVMLDTYNVSIPEKSNFRGQSSKPQYFAMLADKHIRILRDSDWEGRWDYLKFYLGTLGRKSTSPQNRPALPEKVIRSETATREAAQKYEPTYYPGKVIFFKAALGVFADEPSNGWKPEQFGEFEIHTLDCYHGSILFEPIVSQVADIIQAEINSDPQLTK